MEPTTLLQVILGMSLSFMQDPSQHTFVLKSEIEVDAFLWMPD